MPRACEHLFATAKARRSTLNKRPAGLEDIIATQFRDKQEGHFWPENPNTPAAKRIFGLSLGTAYGDT
jgi:hypothetical protein